jgi:putative transposase
MGPSELTVTRRCELLEVSRSTAYHKPVEPTQEELEYEEYICRRLDYWHTTLPALGNRKLTALLQRDGIAIGRKKVRRLMVELNIRPIYPKPNLSAARKNHPKIPYLLCNKPIVFPNQAWAVDITYIPMDHSHMYLTAIIDLYSRLIVGWTLSDTLDTKPVLDALNSAVACYGTPCIVNSDQGSQFTSQEYMDLLASLHIRQSMDGRARWVDNVFIERWFRSLKCECLYITEYNTPRELRRLISGYVNDYNTIRPHESWDYDTPHNIFHSAFAGSYGA